MADGAGAVPESVPLGLILGDDIVVNFCKSASSHLQRRRIMVTAWADTLTCHNCPAVLMRTNLARTTALELQCYNLIPVLKSAEQ